jgi:hypothetical protein
VASGAAALPPTIHIFETGEDGMQWHAQVTQLTLRLYDEPAGYEQRKRFKAVATVFMLGDTQAFIHAFLRSDGTRQIAPNEWRALRRLLHDEHGIELVHSERHGQDRAFNTAPAPL